MYLVLVQSIGVFGGGPFKMWCWRIIEKIKWSEKATNKEVLEHIGENRTLVNNILRRKTIVLDTFEEKITFFLTPLKGR